MYSGRFVPNRLEGANVDETKDVIVDRSSPRPDIDRESLAVIEVGTIHQGFPIADSMAKEAPVELLSAGPIPPGSFLIVIAGGVGEVESSYRRGLGLVSDAKDHLFLAQVHPDVLPAIGPDRPRVEVNALGLFETTSVSSCIHAADSARKGTAISLIHLHLARGLAGKSFALINGSQDMVEAALEIAEDRATAHGAWIGSSLIARPDEVVAQRYLSQPWGFLEGQEVL